MTDNDKAYKMSKILHLDTSSAKSWTISMLDEKAFPTIICAIGDGAGGCANRGIKIYDVKTSGLLLIKFPPTNGQTHVHKNTTHFAPGLNYNNNMLTFLEKLPRDPENPNDDNTVFRITRYFIWNDDNGTKIEKHLTYTINNNYAPGIQKNRLFSAFLGPGYHVDIHDAMDGHLIESLPGYKYLCEIPNKNYVALLSSTHLMLYCVINDKKIMIDRQIKGKYYGGECSVTELNDMYIIITMKSQVNNYYDYTHTQLYKLTDIWIDEKDQCRVCSGFTEKKKALVPCGHTQFCDKCIKTLTKCPLCTTEISSVLNIYT
jgi:hypothetical protein